MVEKYIQTISVEKRVRQSNFFLLDSVINSIEEFKYRPEEEVSFEAYFRHYEEVFKKDCITWGWTKRK